MKKFKLTKEEIINTIINNNIDIFKESFYDKKIILQKIEVRIIKHNYYFFKLLKIPIRKYIDGYYLYISNSIIDEELKFTVWRNDSTAFEEFDDSYIVVAGVIAHKDIIRYLKRIK